MLNDARHDFAPRMPAFAQFLAIDSVRQREDGFDDRLRLFNVDQSGDFEALEGLRFGNDKCRPHTMRRRGLGRRLAGECDQDSARFENVPGVVLGVSSHRGVVSAQVQSGEGGG